MGAVAITTLSGSLLSRSASDWSVLRELLPFLKDMRVPLQYDVRYWSMVFPLGMYAVATFRLSEALGWTSLQPLAFIAQVRRLLRPTATST